MSLSQILDPDNVPVWSDLFVHSINTSAGATGRFIDLAVTDRADINELHSPYTNVDLLIADEIRSKSGTTYFTFMPGGNIFKMDSIGLTVYGRIKFDNTNVASYSPSNLDYYEEWSSSLASSGAWVRSYTVNIVRVGKSVTITLVGDATVSTASASTLAITGIPARFLPSDNTKRVMFYCSGENNGSPVQLCGTLDASGMTIGLATTGYPTAFTNGAFAYLLGFSVPFYSS